MSLDLKQEIRKDNFIYSITLEICIAISYFVMAMQITKNNAMHYIEFVDGNVGNRGTLIKKESLRIKKRSHESFISSFDFDEDIVDHVNKTKSVSFFKGAASSRYLWYDIDVDGSHYDMIEAARDFVMSININYNVDIDNLIIYFTGGRGFHIGIPMTLFGVDRFKSKDINNVFKILSLKIFSISYNFDGESVSIIDDKKPKFDLSIYKKVGIFRLPMSRHKSTGMYKVILSSECILNRDVDNLIKRSHSCTNDHVDRPTTKENKKLSKLLRDSVNEVSAHFKLRAKDSNYYAKVERSVANSKLFTVPEIGNRNELLYKQAYRLFISKSLNYDEVVGIVFMIYELTNIISVAAGGTRLSSREIKSIISSAYRSSAIATSKKVVAKSAESFINEAIAEIATSKYISTLSPSIDADCRGLRHGNYYPMIGARGTKKSIYAQQIAINASMQDTVSIYANMEMAVSTFFDRMMLMLFNKNMESLASIRSIEDITKDLEKITKGNIRLINSNDVSAKEFSIMIDEVENEIGKKVSLLIIDSMNSMKLPNPNNETSSCFTITKELKEVSKEKKSAILQLNHTRQDCPPSLRDNTMYARGGGKITDNADAFFSLFKYVDSTKGDARDTETVKYVNNFIGVRFENKRGSGNVIETSFKLNDNLSLLSCNESDVTAEIKKENDGYEKV